MVSSLEPYHRRLSQVAFLDPVMSPCPIMIPEVVPNPGIVGNVGLTTDDPPAILAQLVIFGTLGSIRK